MARLFSSGFELNTTTNGVEWDTYNTGLGMSMISSGQRSGGYAMQIATPTGTSRARFQYKSANFSGLIYYRDYIYLTALPNGTIVIIQAADASSAQVAAIQVTATGTLQLVNSAGVQTGSDSFALNTGQWYRVELKLDTTTLASSVVEGRIDGNTFASGTISVSGGQARFLIGATTNTSLIIIHDDVAINDSTGSFCNSWCGEEHLIFLNPNADGDAHSFGTQVGGTAGAANNYTRVNEIPPDDATSYNAELTSGNKDSMKCTPTPSVLGKNDIINVVHVGVRFSGAAASANAAFKVRLIKASLGTVNLSNAISPASTTWLTNALASPNLFPTTLYQDPDSINWTKATLDTMQIGYTISAANTNKVQISNVYALVGYTSLPLTINVNINQSINRSNTY